MRLLARTVLSVAFALGLLAGPASGVAAAARPYAFCVEGVVLVLLDSATNELIRVIKPFRGKCPPFAITP